MIAGPVLKQTHSQALLITPQFQLALKVLHCSAADLNDLAEKELLENPILEKEEPETITDSQQASDAAQNPKEEFIPDTFSATTSRNLSEVEHSIENYLPNDLTLEQYLINQLMDIRISDNEKKLSVIIIGNLDEDGYLRVPLESLRAASKGSIEELQGALQIVQSLEPVGVGARDLRECLLLQLDKLGKRDSMEGEIVDQYLSLMEKNDLLELSRILGKEVVEIKSALLALKALNPFPCRSILSEGVGYVIPDVVVKKIGESYVALMNGDALPSLRVSDHYAELVKEKRSFDKESRRYLSSKMKGATWFLRCLRQREQTLRKISAVMVKRQQEFLDIGAEGLKPLTLKEVGDEIGVHESTVSRAISNKFMQTPRGVFEFKQFFTPGLKTKQGEFATCTIKDKIRVLIKAENPESPISDQNLCNLLKNAKIEIARRTVAKYREAMGIAPSSMRKLAIAGSSTA